MRDWTEARAKVRAEGKCRACGRGGKLEASHVVPRSRVTVGGEDARNIVPMCAECHRKHHAGELELLPLLSLGEQSYAAGLVGLVEAVRRTTYDRSRSGRQ